MTLFVSLKDYRAERVRRSSVEGGALSLLDEVVKARLELQQVEIDKPSQKWNPAPTLGMGRLAADAFVFKDLVDETVEEPDDDRCDHQEGGLYCLRAAHQAVADALAKHLFQTHAWVSRALVRKVVAGRHHEQGSQYVLATLNGENVRFDLIVWSMDLRANPILGSLVDGVVAVTATLCPLDNDEIRTNDLKVLMARQMDALGLTHDETLREYQEMVDVHHAWARRR
ncbi:hypothetical protein SGCZBJ_14915 [Caulobacter zeae]|uniref:Uncharacterized protein n=1 Tax=Caulobacter zeae TaxID=2055137 RepID=A0A2N5DD35_9CAUL|nr:hypothetical protein [Caulobacter zeae]PLR23876.1 hypothetical protein SGCZBJ_14915 [Caulobacter zeae]